MKKAVPNNKGLMPRGLKRDGPALKVTLPRKTGAARKVGARYK